MVEALMDLNTELNKFGSKLFLFYGKPAQIINDVIRSINNIDAVYVNKDYSPYSKERDRLIADVCDKYNVTFNSHEDLLLNPSGTFKTDSGNIYEKFTPYFRKAVRSKISPIRQNRYTNYISKSKRISGQYTESLQRFYKHNAEIAVNGGRTNGLKRLNGIEKYRKYNAERDILHIETTRLSAYIRFGCVSIREVYHRIKSKLGMQNELIKQLYWREFFYNIIDSNPSIITGRNKNFKPEYNKIAWIKYDSATIKQKKLWHAWTNGLTGFPVVDAAMRELNITGFMHNRGRLIVASFLTKLMMWSWQDGEKYFATKLVDYDLSNNWGGWTWSSGSGVDSQPYFRIFNPWTQSEKFDKDAIYIKKWCPELKDVPAEHIHKWDEYYNDPEYMHIKYPEPILDYESARERALKLYKKGLYS
jgi:deoxyribodipyrimidine photo-lyase